jgi:hypothetical protein
MKFRISDNLKKVQTLVLESFRFYDDKLEDVLKYTPGIRVLIICGCSWFEGSLSDRWTSAGSPAQIETDHDFRKSLEKLSGRRFRTRLEVSVLQSSSGNVWFPPRAQLRIKYVAVREEQHWFFVARDRIRQFLDQSNANFLRFSQIIMFLWASNDIVRGNE